MKRSKIWIIIGVVIWSINLGILIYWGSQVEDLSAWDYEYKWFPFYGFIAGFIPLGIAAYYSHFVEGDKFDWSKV